ncbi:MAG: hypothetical protein JOZ24_01085, partial [Candidatus Eremiobacteraeota bacterium]|nr:hypothetical protein [Candidatus Eremiobacteraeota bacterium]
MNAPALVAAAFDQVLRAHGVCAGVRRACTFAEVLCDLPPVDADGLYRRARAAMLPSIDDAAAFDRAFAAAFEAPDALAGLLERVDSPPAAPPAMPVRAALAPAPSHSPAPHAEAEAPALLVAASSEERLAERGFDELDASERGAMLRLIARLRVAGER